MKYYLLILIFFSFPAFSQTESLSNYFNEIDASSDRNIMLPNAQTLKEGDLTINDYFIIVPGISYGLTDNLELSLTVQPLDGGMIFDPLYLLSLKIKIIDSGNYIFSTQLIGAAAYITDHESANDKHIWIYNGAISFLFDYFISKNLFISLNLLINPYKTATDGKFTGYLNSDITYLLFRNLKIIFETGLSSDYSDYDESYIVNMGLGFRIFNENYSFDLFGLKSLNKDDMIPFFSFAMKF